MVHSRILAQSFLELAQKPHAEEGIDTLINYIVQNNLTGLLPQTLDHMHRILNRSNEINTLHIQSRFPLEPAHIAHIQDITKAHEAEVVTEIDESIIGGFSATYNGYIYDGSLENQITRLKSMLLQ